MAAFGEHMEYLEYAEATRRLHQAEAPEHPGCCAAEFEMDDMVVTAGDEEQLNCWAYEIEEAVCAMRGAA
jgi:hypothetical protein